MGKSFANFMCKKFFHPSSFANIKRVWLAEQRVKEETKKQDDLRTEYERDQDHYTNRQLMGDERVKHGLTFIYEAPKAYQNEPDKDINGKLEWKKAIPATGESSTPSGSSQDSAGAVVRNVRCVRCHQMGHIPTDRECPMYKSSEEDRPSSGAVNQDQLVEEMRRDGYAFKQSVLGRSIDDANFSKDLLADDDLDDGPPPEEAFLSSLTKKQKKKLLKKLNRMEKKHSGSIHKKKSHKKRRRDDGSSTEEESKKHKKHKKQRRVEKSSDDFSSSDESSDERHHREKKLRRRRESSSQDRDGYKKVSKKRRDSSSDDEMIDRATKMQDKHKTHHSERYRVPKQSIKKERRPEEDDARRSPNGRRPRRDYSSDDEDQLSKSKRRDHSFRDHTSNGESYRGSHRHHDTRERDAQRIKVEEDRGDGRRGRDSERSRDRRDDRYGRIEKKDRK